MSDDEANAGTQQRGEHDLALRDRSRHREAMPAESAGISRTRILEEGLEAMLTRSDKESHLLNEPDRLLISVRGSNVRSTPIVLQKSKIEWRQIFRNNKKRKAISDSYNLYLVAEVACEFNVRR